MAVCMDSVVLEVDLWDRLVGIAGAAPSWVHGCALADGHLEAHHAPAGYRGGHLWWLRWDEGADAELAALAPCANTACMLFDGHGGAHRRHEPVAGSGPTRPRDRLPDPESVRPVQAAATHMKRNNVAANGAAPDSRSSGDAGRHSLPRSAGRGGAGDGTLRPDDLGEIARALWAVAAAVDRLADARADTRLTGPGAPRHSWLDAGP